MSNDVSSKLSQIKQDRAKLPDHVISAAAQEIYEIIGGIHVVLDHYLSNARYLKLSQINALHELFQHHKQLHTTKQKTRHKHSASTAISLRRNSILLQSTTTLSLLDRNYEARNADVVGSQLTQKGRTVSPKENLYMSGDLGPKSASFVRKSATPEPVPTRSTKGAGGALQARLRREHELREKRPASKTAPSTPDWRSSSNNQLSAPTPMKLNRINSKIEELQRTHTHTQSKSLYSRGALKPRPKSAKNASFNDTNMLTDDKLDTMRSMTTFLDCGDLKSASDDEEKGMHQLQHRNRSQTHLQTADVRVQVPSHLRRAQMRSQPNLRQMSQLGQTPRKSIVRVGDVNEKITADTMFDGSDYDRVTEDEHHRYWISEYTEWDSANHAFQSENENEYFNALTRKYRASKNKKPSRKKDKPRVRIAHMPLYYSHDDSDENITRAVSERGHRSIAHAHTVHKGSVSASDVFSKIADEDGDIDDEDGDIDDENMLLEIDQNTSTSVQQQRHMHTHIDGLNGDKSQSTMESPDFLAYFDRFMTENSSFYALDKLGVNE